MVLTALGVAALMLASADAPPIGRKRDDIEGFYERGKGEGKLKRDQLWARVRLDLDKRGYVKTCSVVQTNVRSRDSIGRLCLGFKNLWRTSPATRQAGDTPTTVYRTLVL